MKQYTTLCDVGSIRIFTKDCAFFFANNYGDGEMIVKVFDEPSERGNDSLRFIESFEVKTKAWLSDYDCEENKLHKFERGTYYVYLVKTKNKWAQVPEMHIYKEG